MEITHNQENLKGTVTIKLTKDDYLPKVNEQLKDLRKKVTMKGFRPGHVPMSIVKKMYGTEVLIDEVYKLVNQALLDFIKENKLKLLGDFIPVEDKTDFNPKLEQDYTFTYDYAVTSSPLINYEQITVPYYKVEISDQDLDDEIERIRKQFGTYEPSEEITDDKDIFYVTAVELDQDGNVKEDGFKKDDLVLALNIISQKAQELFKGKKKDDEVIINLSEMIEDPGRRAAMFSIDKEQLDSLSDKFKFIITQVKRFKEAELGEDLYKKYAPGEEIKSEEDFRRKVKENLEKYFENQAKELFKKAAKDILLNSVEVEIPEDFLLRWLIYRQQSKPEEQRLSEEQLKEQIPEIVKSVKWNRILEQIADDLGIKLERKDAIKVHADYMKSMYMQYGIDPNMLGDEFFMQQAEGEFDKLNEDDKYYIESYAFENKVLDALLDKVKLDERPITVEMFESMLKEKQEQDQQTEKEEQSEQAQQQQEQQAEQESEKEPDSSEQQETKTEQSAQQQQNQDDTESNTETENQ